MEHPDFIPAFHFRWLARWYDPMLRLSFPEQALKAELIAQAHIQPSQHILDIGCGTGTLSLMIKQAHPDAVVYGLDVDPQILTLARNKAEQAGADVVLDEGTAACLPYTDGNFDHVFSSLMLHHLVREDKKRALKEAFRVLKPGGVLHVADFGKPHGAVMWLISLMIRWVEEVHDNILGLLPVLISDAGFRPVEESGHYRTVAGSLCLYRAVKPA
jgi:ubiquinone/menaquinone biosynthesis C-methylase UbiE